MNNLLSKLQNWYSSQCNGHWEHSYGIRIETTHKPGWFVCISIQETKLQTKPFVELLINRNESDWIECEVNNGFFVANCSVNNLSEVFKVFLQWDKDVAIDVSDLSDNVMWISHWFGKKCNGAWEHCYGIRISTIDNPGWILNISLDETECVEKKFNTIAIERSNDDWIHCSKKNKIFAAACGPLNLLEIFQIFRNWVEGTEVSAAYTNHTWTQIKRFDGAGGAPHWNKTLKMDVLTPHVHENTCPGGTRQAESWEIPK